MTSFRAKLYAALCEKRVSKHLFKIFLLARAAEEYGFVYFSSSLFAPNSQGECSDFNYQLYSHYVLLQLWYELSQNDVPRFSAAAPKDVKTSIVKQS